MVISCCFVEIYYCSLFVLLYHSRNQRYFVVTQKSLSVKRRDEIDYALQHIRLAFNNESPWQYLRALILHDKSSNLSDETNDSFENAVDYVYSQSVDIEKRAPACSHCVALVTESRY